MLSILFLIGIDKYIIIIYNNIKRCIMDATMKVTGIIPVSETFGKKTKKEIKEDICLYEAGKDLKPKQRGIYELRKTNNNSLYEYIRKHEN